MSDCIESDVRWWTNHHSVKSSSAMSAGPASAGQLLLRRAKCFNGSSAKFLHRVDCIQIVCVRGENATRAAHRCILELGSNFFAHAIRKLRQSQRTQNENTWCNTIHLDVSVESMDIILKYLYLREPIQVSDQAAVETYAAAKRFRIEGVAVHLLQCCQPNLMRCLDDARFWSSPNCKADLNLLIDVFEDLHLDDGAKTRLLQRVSHWSCNGSSLKELTAPRVRRKLRALASMTSASEIRGGPDQAVSVAVHGFHGELNKIIMSFPSMTVILKEKVPLDFISLSDQSVIFRDKIYIIRWTKVEVWHLQTRYMLAKIATSNDEHIEGLRVLDNAILFYTRISIYIIHDQTMTYAKIAQFATSLDGPTILKWEEDEFSIATTSIQDSKVFSCTYRRGNIEPVRVSTLLSNWNHGLRPIGTCGGLLYFICRLGPPYSYVAFRGNIEVKRHRLPFDDCYKLRSCYICNGLLYFDYRAAYEVSRTYFCIMDLSSDTVVFKKLSTELGMLHVSGMMLCRHQADGTV